MQNQFFFLRFAWNTFLARFSHKLFLSFSIFFLLKWYVFLETNYLIVLSNCLYSSYFLEYQFPVIAAARDKYAPNTMATEVTRITAKQVKEDSKYNLNSLLYIVISCVFSFWYFLNKAKFLYEVTFMKHFIWNKLSHNNLWD